MAVATEEALPRRGLLPDADHGATTRSFPGTQSLRRLLEHAQRVMHHRFTATTELWINSALENTNVSRKSYSSTEINEQEG